jgi:hypothetical protein
MDYGVTMSDETIFLVEEAAQKEGAIVCVGRFNPPTAGHYHMFNAMKRFARHHEELKKIFVVVVEGEKTSEDKTRNPLNAEERINFMRASGKANGITFLTATDAFKGFVAVRKAGFEPVAIAAGSDKTQAYLDLLDKSFKDGEKPIAHYAVAGLNRDADGKGVTAISGSTARDAAKMGYEEEFIKMTGLEEKQKLGKKLYELVRKRIGA